MTNAVNEHAINRILLETNTSGATLRSLYQLYKSQHRKVSFSFLCKRTGIPSKGYLAFVMNGKRRLNTKYWAPVCDVFKLNYRQAEVLRLLLEADAEPESRAFHDVKMRILRAELMGLEFKPIGNIPI
ncbi:MAG: hypothetical protein H7249_10115 [Chitinophagaceae bacterium]|nr:hypothetical protein [Oligoflexus sp.]